MQASAPAIQGLILGREMKKNSRRTAGFMAPSTSPAESVATPTPYVCYEGASHVMLFGRTGSGKTAGVFIPAALRYPDQLISFECKGDVYRATAGQRRRMGQKVQVIDLSGQTPDCACLNPIDLYAMAASEPAMVGRDIASAMVACGPKEDPFWPSQSKNMITAGVVCALTSADAGSQNFAMIHDLYQGDVNYKLAGKLDTEALHLATRHTWESYLSTAEGTTRPSILASTQQHLSIWESDLVRKLTQATSIDLEALVRGDPMSIYFIVPPVRLHSLGSLVRLWIDGLLAAIMSTRREKTKARTLFMCDELGAVGEIPALVTACTLGRSYGIRLLAGFQNPGQLEIYGHQARTLVDNAGVLQLLGASNLRMAKEFADLTGGITPEEIMSMGQDESLAFVDGELKHLKRIYYFKEEALVELAHLDPVLTKGTAFLKSYSGQRIPFGRASDSG